MHFITVSLGYSIYFPGKFHFLVKTITDWVRLGVVYLKLVLGTANEIMFFEVYLQSAAHNDITTIHDLFKIYFISSFFKDPRSPIPDPRFSIPDRSFPVNLEVLLQFILFFDHWSNRLS